MGLFERWFGGRSGSDGGQAARGDAGRIAEVEALLAELRPLVALDGGDLRLEAIEEGRVTLRWQGACSHCSAQPTTAREVVEPLLRERLAWFTELVTR